MLLHLPQKDGLLLLGVLIALYVNKADPKLMLGILGVKYSDKAAIKEIGQSPMALMEELKANRVAFGFAVKTVERGGYENCNIVTKEANFIPMDKAEAYLD